MAPICCIYIYVERGAKGWVRYACDDNGSTTSGIAREHFGQSEKAASIILGLS